MNNSTITFEIDKNSCPACSSKRDRAYREDRFYGKVRECSRCGAIYTQNGSAIYKGEASEIVLPFWSTDPEADARAKYFDLTLLGSDGITREHGWFDPITRRITQTG